MTTICGHIVERNYTNDGWIYGWNIYNNQGKKVAWFSQPKDLGEYLWANNPDKEPDC